MSTQGAVGFIANEKWYVTYNNADSNPDWLGMRVLEFCKSIISWDYLKTLVTKLTLVDEECKPTPEQIELYKGYSDSRVSQGTLEDWYCLLRGLHQGKILYEIASGNVTHMIDNHLFLSSSLYCEWAYIIDLDSMTLKIYNGFNENGCDYGTLPEDIDPRKEDDGFYPVRFLYAYDLRKLPEFMLGVTNEFKKEYRERRPKCLSVYI